MILKETFCNLQVSGPSSGPSDSTVMSDMNAMLLTELKSLNAKMDSMEKRLVATEQKLQSPATDGKKKCSRHGSKAKKVQAQASSSTDDSSDEEVPDPELVLPSTKYIKKNPKIQEQVQARIEELKQLDIDHHMTN